MISSKKSLLFGILVFIITVSGCNSLPTTNYIIRMNEARTADTAQALKIIESIERDYPEEIKKDAEFWILRGSCYMAEMRIVQAIQSYEKAYHIHPDPALLYSLGDAQYQKGDYEKALGCAGSLIKEESHFMPGFILYVESLLALNKTEKALQVISYLKKKGVDTKKLSQELRRRKILASHPGWNFGTAPSWFLSKAGTILLDMEQRDEALLTVPDIAMISSTFRRLQILFRIYEYTYKDVVPADPHNKNDVFLAKLLSKILIEYIDTNSDSVLVCSVNFTRKTMQELSLCNSEEHRLFFTLGLTRFVARVSEQIPRIAAFPGTVIFELSNSDMKQIINETKGTHDTDSVFLSYIQKLHEMFPSLSE